MILPVSVELSRLADGCAVMSGACRLAGWVGGGRPVTAKCVLRRADVAEAGRVIGVAVAARVRSAADVEQLHHPWVVALATGLLVLQDDRVVAGPGSVDDPLQVWLAGLDAVMRAESRDRRRCGAGVACRSVLSVLAADPLPRERVEGAVHRLLERGDLAQASDMYDAFGRGQMPVDAALGVLAEFGAVDDQGRLTPLGRWAEQQLRDGAGGPVTPELPAAVLLTRLAAAADEDEGWALTKRWRGDRSAAEAAAELLRAAASATPVQRVAAVDAVAGLGEEALPAWRAALDLPELAAHARAILAGWRLGPEPDDAQRRWLVTEYALLALARDGAEAAHHDVSERGGLQALQASGHPGENVLREAVTGFVASGRRPRVFQLKIALSRARPPVWRRVLVPASLTLGDLHAVIRVVLGWGNDHLHEFTANGARYSDPFYELDDCDDENIVRLSRVLPVAGATMTYVYDFGDWWAHTITLEKTIHADPAATYPTCLTGRGDAPVEDWNPEYPEEPTPFDRDDINRRLAALNSRAPQN
jgi:hypothetical protein